MVKVNRGAVRSWNYQCPECDFGDREIGQLVADDDIYCEVCLTEAQLYVRLRRWSEDAEEDALVAEARCARA